MRVFAIFVFLLLGGAAVQAQPRNPMYGEPTDFYGTWHNVEVQRNVVVRIEIRPDYNGRVRVTVFGLHNGEPCVFGEYRGAFFYAKNPKDREQDNSAILVKVEKEFVHGHVLLRFNSRGEIVSHALISSGRARPHLQRGALCRRQPPLQRGKLSSPRKLSAPRRLSFPRRLPLPRRLRELNSAGKARFHGGRAGSGFPGAYPIHDPVRRARDRGLWAARKAHTRLHR